MSRHAVRFFNPIQDARTCVEEVSVEDVLKRHRRKDSINLIDVREIREWLHSHIPSARHLSKGIIERDVEMLYRQMDEELILYCSDGNRSLLAAANLVRMGYTKVTSMAGGFRAWKKAGGPIGL